METKTLAQVHPELFHYTGYAGLKGIIQTQQLWATQAAYLNDSSEIRIFQHRVEEFIRPTVEHGIQTLAGTGFLDRQLISNAGGESAAVEEYVTTLCRVMFETLLDAKDSPAGIEPYITSFCTPATSQVAEHGLLSQWRSYGRSGGFSIVFDMAKLDLLLTLEGDKWKHDLFGGDVIYSSDTVEKFNIEFGGKLQKIAVAFSEYLQAPGSNHAFLDTYQPLVHCACRYKHWGFYEEREVRIITIPVNEATRRFAERTGTHLPAKPVYYFKRNGRDVPSIHLFEGITHLPDLALPINRIIVGPSYNQSDRQREVTKLLSDCRLDIPVTLSEIPYVENSQ